MSNLEAPPSAENTLLLLSRLRQALDSHADSTALIFHDRSYPRSFFTDAVRDLDTVLAPFGAARRIGVVLRNRPGPLAVAVAAIASGRQVVTLSPHLGDTGLGEDIESLRPDVIAAEAEDWARAAVKDAVRAIGAVPLLTSTEPGLQPVQEMVQAGWTPSPACLPMDDVPVLMMTSGTTGKPKRVALSYEQLTASFLAAGTRLDGGDVTPRRGVAILWSPLVHISGLYFVLDHLLEGRPFALMERFNVADWVDLVREHRPGYLRLPPAAIRMVLSADVPVDTFSSVRAVGAGTAPVPPELSEAFEQKYGVPVLIKYGATEFAGAIAGWSLADHRENGRAKRGSVGRAHRGIELRVVDPDSFAVLPSGEIGLLEVRGGQLPTQDGEWLRTNDLASLDADGYLFIHGRADDAINRGGFKIPPSVIEDALRTHPAVLEPAAVSLPDDRLGEVPVAGVTLRSPVTTEELLEHLSTRLTSYEMPVSIHILDALPQTTTMKVDRALLRQLILDADEYPDGTPEVP